MYCIKWHWFAPTLLWNYTHMCLVVDYISHLMHKRPFFKEGTFLNQCYQLEMNKKCQFWLFYDQIVKLRLSKACHGDLKVEIFSEMVISKFAILWSLWSFVIAFLKVAICEKWNIFNFKNWPFLKFHPIKWVIFRNWLHFTNADGQILKKCCISCWQNFCCLLI